ncbi:MAG: helix-turn-helix domain-containing protein [Desulfovibrio sp.]|jgi:transposase|nr:helix-turn-helix domain-containing protein [Desulfovibrio sp.]
MPKKGKANPEIAQALDVSERHVRNVKKLCAEQGISGIKPERRGRTASKPSGYSRAGYAAEKG